ncbi:hypothetical protein [Maribacter sp.]|uniref:hypothetical protein n=1 Tax=Maribacter sp. TaxID=1897614 RepID=UPI0025C1B9D7|nr:hypothetical protein [Maribacter sp.]
MILRTTEHFNQIGKKRIPSKCPDCGNQDCLELNFYQSSIESGFLITVSKKVTGMLFCHHTKTEIAPVLWTDDIENRFENEKSKLPIKPKSTKVIKSSLVLFLAPLLIIGAIIGYLMWQNKSNADPTESIENTSIGDKIKVNYAGSDTWLLINAIDGDTLFLKPHKNSTTEEGSNVDLDNSNFTGETIKASLQHFSERKFQRYEGEYLNYSGFIKDVKKQE